MAKKIWILVALIVLVAAALLFASAENPQVLTGEAQGYGGRILATVTVENDRIRRVEIDAPDETAGIGTRAIEALPVLMEKTGTPDVDVVTGATVTSNGIINAVKNALGITPSPTPQTTQVQGELSLGFGLVSMGRTGPGTDETGANVYSVNQAFVGALFDAQGKITFVKIDQLEFATPNYDGASMPDFTGFPGQVYNEDAAHNGTVSGQKEADDASFETEIAAFKTKRERGADYSMGTGTWETQITAYEQLFLGKTVEEVVAWSEKFCSNKNGRPLSANATDEADKQKYAALSEEEKQTLQDVTSAATMSLNDSHGNILGALQMAYDNRQSIKGAPLTFGMATTFLPTKGDSGAYTINEIYALALFDESDRVVGAYIDHMEIVSDNAQGATKFSGFPGQQPLGSEEKEITDDTFLTQVASWKTKRELGDAYQMPAGSWASQMDAFQQQFLGKTLPELDIFIATHFGQNGKPLKKDAENEDDAQKYDALTAEQKQAVDDLVSSASMSLQSDTAPLYDTFKKAFDARERITDVNQTTPNTAPEGMADTLPDATPYASVAPEASAQPAA